MDDIRDCDEVSQTNDTKMEEEEQERCDKDKVDEAVMSIEANESDIIVKKNEASKRNFKQYWLQVKGFQPWLEVHRTDETKAWCNVCKKSFGALFPTIKGHALSKKHLEKCGITVPAALDFGIPFANDREFKRQIAEAELMWCGILQRSNVAFQKSPTLLNDVRYMITKFPKFILDNMKVGATKARDLTVNVIGKAEEDEIADDIKGSSGVTVYADESTDASKNKALAIMLRYVSPIDYKIRSRFWKMVTIFEKGKKAFAGSQRLFDCLTNTFQKHSIPLEKIIACCFDGCNTMIGEESGLKALLTKRIPSIKCITCPAHITHKCAEHAQKNAELPEKVTQLFHLVNKIFKSSNKLHDLEEIQDELLLPRHRLLKMVPTRWLSLENSVNRILEQFDALLELTRRLSEESDIVGTQLYNILTDESTKCYLLVLQTVLGQLNALNRFIQRGDVVIHKLQGEIEKRFKNIVSIMLKRSYVVKTPASQIDLYASENYLDFVDFEFGEEVREYLTLHDEGTEEFCIFIYNYILAVANEMKKRFDNFQNPVFEVMACVDPVNVLNAEFNKSNSVIFDKLLNLFPHLYNNDDGYRAMLKYQWNDIIRIKKQIPKQLMQFDTPVEEFWQFLLTYSEKEQYIFSAIAHFALTLLIMPHGNAGTEREFSEMNFCKDKTHNRISPETIDGLLRAREAIRIHIDNGMFKPSKRMVDLLLKKDYYKHKKDFRKKKKSESTKLHIIPYLLGQNDSLEEEE